MLNQCYLPQGNTWKRYPSAKSIEKFIACLANIQFKEDSFAKIHQENGPDSLLDNIAASLLAKTALTFPLFDEAKQRLINQAFNLEQNTLTHLRETHKLNCEVTYSALRLWLFDSKGQKIMSGFFDAILIDEYESVGIVLKHTLNQHTLVCAQEDKELGCLALIASDVFKLKEVIVVSLQTYFDCYDLGAYNFESLQAFRYEIQKLLQIA
jgi:hypothetical protein